MRVWERDVRAAALLAVSSVFDRTYLSLSFATELLLEPSEVGGLDPGFARALLPAQHGVGPQRSPGISPHVPLRAPAPLLSLLIAPAGLRWGLGSGDAARYAP